MKFAKQGLVLAGAAAAHVAVITVLFFIITLAFNR
jgi:hypothetical protein